MSATDSSVEAQYAKIKLDKKLHTTFLERHVQGLPQAYSGQECNKLTLIYFVLASLDALGTLDQVFPDDRSRQRVVDFVYSLQVVDASSDDALGGWRGSHFFGLPFCSGNKHENTSACSSSSLDSASDGRHQHDLPHIAMVYVALAILRIMGDDFSRVNRDGVRRLLGALQQDDGSFRPTPIESESDVRFVYCACAISYFLNDWSGVDRDRATQFILRSESYESALGQGPGQESHGGSTYCGVAALWLMDRLDEYPDRERLVRWCCERQIAGFQGRSNKPADTCYSFWVGATLALLGHADLIDSDSSRGFTFCCQSKIGGVGKTPDAHPDVLHTYYGIAGLSVAQTPDELMPIHCALAITQRAANGLKKVVE
jgi:geranylgeranyl transferase type-1 subunit beta